jgi:AmiR/NasT family two-component response regulator
MTSPEPSPRRVVLAEDEALIRLDLKEMLEEEGFSVVGEAGDGEQAVALATELRPDLVVLDVKMPRLDGISAAEQIARARLAPVVILTAFSQRDLVERAREAGAMAYLVKPFTKADLLPAVEMAMARFDETAALEAEVSDLKERLETRKRVDRAKGLLQSRHGLDEAAAYRWLQRASMDARRSMREVAELVIEDLSAGDGPAAGVSPS